MQRMKTASVKQGTNAFPIQKVSIDGRNKVINRRSKEPYKSCHKTHIKSKITEFSPMHKKMNLSISGQINKIMQALFMVCKNISANHKGSSQKPLGKPKA